jgi:nitrite reductase/ring-hydroxylating ferredoxin subunit
VLDWEHLPWLHDAAFERIERVDSGSWGWRARLSTTSRPRDELTVEIRIERDALRYVTRTLEGQGAGTEIWTQLEPRGEGSTAIYVEFWLPGVPEGQRDRMGKSYVELYQALWSEDEEMMRLRESRLAARPGRIADDVELGPRSELLSRLPLLVEAGGETWRIVQIDGELFVHTTRCPHRLGPLGEEDDHDLAPYEVRCPWHGYRFDVRSGHSCDGRALRLRASPRIEVQSDDARVTLCFEGS